jgi:hypothetical protein
VSEQPATLLAWARFPDLHWSLPDCRYTLAAWWHLLSLDAPTVAVLWAWFFVRAMHLRVPPLAVLLLGGATWLLYVADRILDGLRQERKELLRDRHLFHARHRRAFLFTALALATLLACMVLTRMYARALREDLFLATFALLYLLLVHAASRVPARRRRNWLPKELVVGVIFASATAVPAWSRLSERSEGARIQLFEAVVFFAALCWINCVAIEKWETGARPFLEHATLLQAHSSTRWAGDHLQAVLAFIALLSVIAACLAPASGLRAVYLAFLLSSGLILILDARRSRIAPLQLRIAVDAALLTPLAFFPILR